MTDKEQLEEIKRQSEYIELSNAENFIVYQDMKMKKEHYDWLIEQAERVQELEKKLEKESRVRKYLRNKNKLYLNTIRKAERLTDYEANVILRKALEGEK